MEKVKVENPVKYLLAYAQSHSAHPLPATSTVPKHEEGYRRQRT